MFKKQKIILFLITISLNSFSTEQLLESYVDLQPYHIGMQEIVPVVDEAGKIKIGVENNLEKLKVLLKTTEENYNIDQSFLSSELGLHYNALSNYIKNFEKMQSCTGKFGTKKRVEEILKRVSDNISLYATKSIASKKSERQLDSERVLLELIAKSVKIDKDLPPLANFESKILVESLNKSIEVKVFLEKGFRQSKFKSGNLSQSILEDICVKQDQKCNELETKMISLLIQNQDSAIKSDQFIGFDRNELAIEINQKVDKLNKILNEYNQSAIDLRNKWLEEDTEFSLKNFNEMQKQRRASRIRQKRKKELNKLKRKLFENYQVAYVGIHQGLAGDLLQTDTLKDSLGVRKLDEQKALYFGFGGFTEKILQDTSDFPLLNKIDVKIVDTAIEEAIKRVNTQLFSLINTLRSKRFIDKKYTNADKTYGWYKKRRVDSLKNLLVTNPAAIGEVLFYNPKFANNICDITLDLAKSDRNSQYLRNGAYLVLGGGLAIASFASLATFGGTMPLTAMIVATIGGVSFTAGDFTFQKHHKKISIEKEQAILNAYISGVGDNRSIDEIRLNWKQSLEADYHGKVALGLGVFDLLAIAPAARAGAALRIGRSIDNLDLKLSENTKLVRLLASNDDYIKVVRSLLENHTKNRVGQFLGKVAQLDKTKQVKVLGRLVQYMQQRQLDARAIVAYLRSEEAFQDLGPDEILNLNRGLLKEDESLATLLELDRSRAYFITDPEIAPYLKQFDIETQYQIVDSLEILKAQGKSDADLALIFRKAPNKCSL